MFTTLTQSLSFHQSPEAFISSRLQPSSTNAPSSLTFSTSLPPITRATLLNRDVHIISSHRLCSDILTSPSTHTPSPTTCASSLFSAGLAYRELMKDWFGADSLLLEDNDLHIAHKSAWKAQLAPLPSDIEPDLRSTTRAFIAREFQPGNRIDLYEMMKTLAWELLLGAFLGFDTEGAGSEGFHAKVESLQETLLRGQFSLLPLSISTPFYQSPRSRGLRARAQLQDLLSKHIQQQTPGRCPLLRKTEVGEEDVARHALLFTSSIANKALASLMVASVMNVFLREGGELVGGLKGEGARDGMVLRSLLRETERLSPPVVGVMRRTNGEVVLQGGGEREREGHAVGKGHDVWMYFVGAGRDESVFEDAQMFHFDRFMTDDTTPQGFAFGGGAKTCLGRDIARLMVRIVVEELLDAEIELQGEPQSKGVQAWLGWEATSGAEAIARDLKQLPCQRPRRPVWVEVSRERGRLERQHD